MVKIKRVEEAPSKKSGGSKPDGDYKFYVLEASLKVETINIPQYGGEKRFDDFEIVANDDGSGISVKAGGKIGVNATTSSMTLSIYGTTRAGR